MDEAEAISLTIAECAEDQDWACIESQLGKAEAVADKYDQRPALPPGIPESADDLLFGFLVSWLEAVEFAVARDMDSMETSAAKSERYLERFSAAITGTVETESEYKAWAWELLEEVFEIHESVSPQIENRDTKGLRRTHNEASALYDRYLEHSETVPVELWDLDGTLGLALAYWVDAIGLLAQEDYLTANQYMSEAIDLIEQVAIELE